jgi:NurA-like 5'-3' nuclease
MAQKRSQPVKSNAAENKSTISVCDIMHTNATNVIEKMESLLPINMQMYSDFYTEYLHSLQDLFGACYIAENEVLAKMGIDQKALQSFDTYAKTVSKSTIAQIEMANNIQKTHLQNQISAIKTLDEYIRLTLDYYSRMLSRSLNSPFQKISNH